MGEQVPVGSCWMTRRTMIDVTEATGSHRNRVLRKVTVVRLLAFLQDPSDENWQNLSAKPSDEIGSRPVDSPFSHRCGNGANQPGQTGCINGIEHGRFANRDENESHKACTNGALALCPGHGVPPVRCIFVHADGLSKPCRMAEGHVPTCQCARRCYP